MNVCLRGWGIAQPLKAEAENHKKKKFDPQHPQGQGIVERAHHTLKAYITKQKGGLENVPLAPKTIISVTLFTLNFLNLDDQGRSAAERHNSWPTTQKELVKWKDVISGKWKGPDPILIRSRGAICVFPQEEENPIWVPERLTRKVLEEKDGGAPATVTPDPDGDDGGRRGTTLGNLISIPETDASSP